MRLTAVIVILPLVIAIGNAAAMQKAMPSCTDNSRDCMLAAAKSYLQAVVTHDGAKALLHPNVRLAVHGDWLLDGEDAVRKSLSMEPDMLPDRNTQYFIDEPQRTVVIFSVLPIKATNSDQQRESHDIGGKEATVYIAQRLKVDDGSITEIEVIFYQKSGALDLHD